MIQEFSLKAYVSIVVLVISVHQTVFAEKLPGYVVGNAFELNGSELLYTETHCKINNRASEVFYQSDDGKLIAHKALDYQSGSYTPSFVQYNLQSNEKVKVSFDEQSVLMSMTGPDDNERQEKHSVTDTGRKPVVIDAGFDQFVRRNWDELVSGKSMEFQFPLASRSTMITLQIAPSTCQYETETDQCFTLEAASWLFRMLSSPIELGYDSKLVRLNRFRGLSNINDKNGDGLIVDIKYRYPATIGDSCQINKPFLNG